MNFGTLLGISVGILENSAWKESSVPPAGRVGNELSDSSSSEAEKEPSAGAVHFVVGDGSEEPTVGKVVGISSKEKSNITRSYSQDTNVLNEERTSSVLLPKTSYSENSLDVSDRSYRPASTTTTMITTTTMTTSMKKPLRELPTVMSVDDETLSTDSNSTADNDELKRRRRKLHFPAFRKNKAKVT